VEEAVAAEPSAEERRRGVQPWRRVFHAGNGLMISFFPPMLGLGRWQIVAILGGFLVLLTGFDLARLRSPKLNVLFFRLFPSLASPREMTKIASSTWYLLGAIVVFALFPARLAVPAILVLALADPAASTVGRLWGRRKIGKGSWLGSTVFAVIAFAILAAYFGPAAAAAPALIIAAAEILPWSLDDNLTVPIVGATALWLLGV
jgi:dolichol kinase